MHFTYTFGSVHPSNQLSPAWPSQSALPPSFQGASDDSQQDNLADIDEDEDVGTDYEDDEDGVCMDVGCYNPDDDEGGESEVEREEDDCVLPGGEGEPVPKVSFSILLNVAQFNLNTLD